MAKDDDDEQDAKQALPENEHYAKAVSRTRITGNPDVLKFDAITEQDERVKQQPTTLLPWRVNAGFFWGVILACRFAVRTLPGNRNFLRDLRDVQSQYWRTPGPPRSYHCRGDREFPLAAVTFPASASTTVSRWR
jgi:hypothetical protein